jgi:hypothetical protein
MGDDTNASGSRCAFGGVKHINRDARKPAGSFPIADLDSSSTVSSTKLFCESWSPKSNLIIEPGASFDELT